MLAELSATSITKAKNPQTLDENKTCAKEGGDVARVAREELESKTGRQVISPLSAKRFFEAQQPKKSLEDNNNNKQSKFRQIFNSQLSNKLSVAMILVAFASFLAMAVQILRLLLA